jgi:hypothetical protein
MRFGKTLMTRVSWILESFQGAAEGQNIGKYLQIVYF